MAGVNGSGSVIASMAQNIAAVEKLLGGYRFKQPELLAEALTHPSHSPHGPNHVRLAFIGDAALSLIISTHFFITSPHLGRYRLTDLRSANVSTEKLARIAVRYHLYPLLLRVAADLDLLVDQFTAAVDAENVAGDHDSLVAYGGTTVSAPKVLADVVESIIGAVFVDSGFNLETTWVSIRSILEPIITDENYHEQPMSELHKICQKSGRTLEFERIDGTQHFTKVFVDGNQVGVGCSNQKKIADLNAARDALSKLDVKESVTPMLDATSATADRYTDSTTYSSSAAALTASPTMSTTTDGEKEGKKNLNDLCTKNHWISPIYSVEEAGPAHERRFRCSVEVKSPSCVVASGDFKSKIKDAEHSAAYKMLIKLRSTDHET